VEASVLDGDVEEAVWAVRRTALLAFDTEDFLKEAEVTLPSEI